MNQHRERLAGLAPFLIGPATRLLDLCQQSLGRRLLVVSGFRSIEDQLQKYQQGRRWDRASQDWIIDDPTRLLTHARPGLSAHNVVRMSDRAPAALGLDVIPFDATGRPDWEVEDRFWTDLYELAWKVGLDPLGDSIGAVLLSDKGHFEEPAWKLKLEGFGLVQLGSLPPAQDV